MFRAAISQFQHRQSNKQHGTRRLQPSCAHDSKTELCPVNNASVNAVHQLTSGGNSANSGQPISSSISCTRAMLPLEIAARRQDSRVVVGVSLEHSRSSSRALYLVSSSRTVARRLSVTSGCKHFPHNALSMGDRPYRGFSFGSHPMVLHSQSTTSYAPPSAAKCTGDSPSYSHNTSLTQHA